VGVGDKCIRVAHGGSSETQGARILVLGKNTRLVVDKHLGRFLALGCYNLKAVSGQELGEKNE